MPYSCFIQFYNKRPFYRYADIVLPNCISCFQSLTLVQDVYLIIYCRGNKKYIRNVMFEYGSDTFGILQKKSEKFGEQQGFVNTALSLCTACVQLLDRPLIKPPPKLFDYVFHPPSTYQHTYTQGCDVICEDHALGTKVRVNSCLNLYVHLPKYTHTQHVFIGF